MASQRRCRQHRRTSRGCADAAQTPAGRLSCLPVAAAAAAAKPKQHDGHFSAYTVSD